MFLIFIVNLVLAGHWHQQLVFHAYKMRKAYNFNNSKNIALEFGPNCETL